MSPRDVDGRGRIGDPDPCGSDTAVPDETPENSDLDDVLARWRDDVTRPVRVDPALAVILHDGLTPVISIAPVTSREPAASREHPQRRGRARRIAVRAAVIGVASATVSSGLAAAGVLPTPVRRVVSNAAGAVGIEISEPVRPRLAPPPPPTSEPAPVEVIVPPAVERPARTSTADRSQATSARGNRDATEPPATAAPATTPEPPTHAKPPKADTASKDERVTPTRPDKPRRHIRPCRARRSDAEVSDGRSARRCRPCHANARRAPRPNSCRPRRWGRAEGPHRTRISTPGSRTDTG
jgi:hypothetical protein